MAYPNRQCRPISATIRNLVPIGVATFGLMALVPAALAQDTGTDPTNTPRVDANEGFGSSESSGNIFGEGTSALQLIHRAVLMNETSMSDFSRQQRNRINDAAATYRTLQRDAFSRQAQPEAAGDNPAAADLETGAD